MPIQGPRSICGKAVYELFLPSFRDWPERLMMSSPRFVLLVAASLKTIPTRHIDQLVDGALDSGAAYVCALGPRAEQIELAFDMAIVGRLVAAGRKPRLDTVIPTTSHEDLADGVSYFLNCAQPASRFAKSCRSWLAVTVSDRSLYRRIRHSLSAHERWSKEWRTRPSSPKVQKR